MNYITTLIKRKYVILISVFVSLLSTGLSITSFNFYFASINRFVSGFCFRILDILIYLNLFESLPTKIRGFVSTMILLFFPLGEFALSLTCYFKLKEGQMEVNYKFMLLFPFIFTCIICLSAIFLQESPRELFFGKQEFEKGAESFKKINELNRDESNKNKFNFGDPEIDKAANDINIELGIISDQDNNDAQNQNEFPDNINNNKNIQKSLLRQESNNKIFKMSRFRQLFSEEYLRSTILFWILGSFSGFIFYGIHFVLPKQLLKLIKTHF